MVKFIFAAIICFVVAGANNLNNLNFNQESNPVTVMSYNIRYDNPGDGANAWPNRKDKVAEMIGSRYSSDIVGLQEVLFHQLEDLQERLPDYNWVGAGRDDGHRKGELSPIMYKSDMFELVATNTFWLSETPQMPGSTSWDTAITRIATWAKFKDRRNDKEFYVLNTHFDHRGEVARVESAKIMSKKVSDFDDDLPIIITGDFNVNERSEAYSIMTETEGIYDARYKSESGHEGPTTSSNNWEEMRGPESRIDYIFVNQHVNVHTHRILDDKYDGRFPSDHLPVVAEVVLTDN